MREEINGLTPEEQEAKARLDQKLAGCTTEEEAYRIVMGEMNPDSNGELDEASLDMVAGGMSGLEAVKIVTVSYWAICVQKRTPPYSRQQIGEAVRLITNVPGRPCPPVMWQSLKRTLGL